jgi:hypothetical protein
LPERVAVRSFTACGIGALLSYGSPGEAQPATKEENRSIKKRSRELGNRIDVALQKGSAALAHLLFFIM